MLGREIRHRQLHPYRQNGPGKDESDDRFLRRNHFPRVYRQEAEGKWGSLPSDKDRGSARSQDQPQGGFL